MSRFIVLEGIDGAGTTTQAQRLVAWLASEGFEVHPTQEPSDGPVGRIIRQTLQRRADAPDPETLPWLFAADRADHLAREIEPALAAGRIVVSDRYYHSSMAYQSLVIPLPEVHALNRSFRVPDLTIYLDVPVDDALSRIDARGGTRDLFEDRERLQRITHQYRLVLDLLLDDGQPLVEIDGTEPPDRVAATIRTHATALMR